MRYFHANKLLEILTTMTSASDMNHTICLNEHGKEMSFLNLMFEVTQLCNCDCVFVISLEGEI